MFFRINVPYNVRTVMQPERTCVTSSCDDESYYPPESAIKPEYIEKIKRIHSHTMQNKGKVYNSMEEFLDSL